MCTYEVTHVTELTTRKRLRSINKNLLEAIRYNSRVTIRFGRYNKTGNRQGNIAWEGGGRRGMILFF